MTEDLDTRIGTVDIPERTDRERYFRELTYLELSALFGGPLKPSVVEKWAQVAPPGTLGIVAPFVLTHRKPPASAKPWQHDATSGDFRDSGPGRVALAALRTFVDAVSAACVVFRSPPVFAASAANRAQLERFFGEIATEEAVGAPRVWVPDGLWDVRTAVAFGKTIDVAVAFDPLVRDPGQPPEVFYDLDVTSLYLRISGLGRGTTPIRSEKLDELAELLESYERVPAIVAFDSAARWQDARNLRKLLAG